MGLRTAYPHGDFCYVELMTGDHDRAVAAYTHVLGLTAESQDVPEGSYTRLLLDGQIAAAVGTDPAQVKAGVPPHWVTYVAVDDLKATHRRAVEAGAEETLAPFAIPDMGQLSGIRDPTGATLFLWQADGQHGSGVVNEIGAWSWSELMTRDMAAAEAFYGPLFGWTFDPMPEDSGPPYHAIKAGDRMLGGLTGLPEGSPAPPAWNVYFAVADVDAAVAGMTELGGKVFVEPFDMSAGRMAVVADPTGAAVSFITPGEPMDP